MGIYADHSTSHVYAFDNIVRNTRYAAHYSNGGGHSLAVNNIFADDTRALYDLEEIRNDSAKENQSFRNIFLAGGASVIPQMYYLSCYELSADRAADVRGTMLENPKHYVNSDWNVFHSRTGTATFLPAGGFAQWQAAGVDRNSLEADPGLSFGVAPDGSWDGSYELAAGSPARELGFEDIDVSRIGPGAPEDPELGLHWTDVESHSYRPAVEGGSATFTIDNIASASPFMLYAAFDRFNGLDARIESEYGTTYFRVADVLPANVNSSWQTHIGTYLFEPGRNYRVTFSWRGGGGGSDGGVGVGAGYGGNGGSGGNRGGSGGVGAGRLPAELTVIAKSDFALGRRTELMETVVTADGAPSLAIGQSVGLAPVAVLGSGARSDFDEVLYEYDPGIVSVDGDGALTAVGNGLAKVVAVGVRNGVAVPPKPITVNAGSFISSIALEGPQGVLDVGDKARLSVRGVGNDGSEISLEGAEVAYRAEPEGIVEIGEGGELTAIARGTARITATALVGGEPMEASEALTVIVGRPGLAVHFDFDEAASGNEPAIDHGAEPAGSGVFSGSAARTGDTPGGHSLGALSSVKDGTLGYVAADAAASGKAAGLGKFTIAFWYKDKREAVELYDRLMSTSTNVFDLYAIAASPADSAKFRFYIDGLLY
jgi:hypothetical protein